MKDFQVYSVGLAYASVCTDLPLKEATKRLNQEHPTGINSEWEPSKDKSFKGGQPNPCECPDRAGNKHYLFEC